MCAFLLLSFPRHKPERADLNASSLNYLLSSTSTFNLPPLCASPSSPFSSISLSFSSSARTHFSIQPTALCSLTTRFKSSRRPCSRRTTPSNYRFVCCSTTNHVIRCHSKDFLDCICCTISFKCPTFHFTKALSTEL